MDTEEYIFSDISGKRYRLTDVLERTHLFIADKPRERYQIIIGSDSHPANTVQFITAITIRRIGNGGIYFWTRSAPEVCHTLRDRIYREVMHSIMLAQELRGRLKEVLGDEYFWNDQVHIDVGELGETRNLVSGVVGMVAGYGFEAVIKPDAFGACVVADRHT
jgi:uncharacterized protein